MAASPCPSLRPHRPARARHPAGGPGARGSPCAPAPGAVDLRAVAAALTGRTDVADWRVELGRSSRDDADELLVHVVPAARRDPSEVAVALARDVRPAAGLLPTQVVVDDDGWLPDGPRLSRRLLV